MKYEEVYLHAYNDFRTAKASLNRLFATFKKRVTQRLLYSTRDDAKTEVFNFIEVFYDPIKRHSHTGGVSPAQFEEDYFSRLGSV